MRLIIICLIIKNLPVSILKNDYYILIILKIKILAEYFLMS